MIVASELAALTAPCSSPCALSGTWRDSTPLIAGAARPLTAPMHDVDDRRRTALWMKAMPVKATAAASMPTATTGVSVKRLTSGPTPNAWNSAKTMPNRPERAADLRRAEVEDLDGEVVVDRRERLRRRGEQEQRQHQPQDDGVFPQRQQRAERIGAAEVERAAGDVLAASDSGSTNRPNRKLAKARHAAA